MTVTLYHNPRCSKSRAALAYLEENGIAADVRLYLNDAPGADEIRNLYAMLGLSSPRGMMRIKDDLFKELGLQDEQSENALLAALAAHPALLERPIAVYQGKAAIGRPLENIIELLDSKAV
ncbi:MAG: arsenate reductase (glutaredoxin) [Neisseria sp.]|nr:arsenate reductase (glutaredoxin) [Neisseria sp.]